VSATAKSLSGRHILLVEDEYFIADDLKRSITKEGAEVVGPVATIEDAMRLVESTATIDGAVLDINLRGQVVYPVADRLMAQGIPFLFLTGYDARAIPEKYASIVRCDKPLAMGKVVAALG
jgi:CheY-like chemotaxis protein